MRRARIHMRDANYVRARAREFWLAEKLISNAENE